MKLTFLLERQLDKKFALELQQALIDRDFDAKVIDPRGLLVIPPAGDKHHRIKYTVSLAPSHNFPGYLNISIQTGDFGWNYGSKFDVESVIGRIREAIKTDLDDDLHGAEPDVNS